jgi:hypothetical protein
LAQSDICLTQAKIQEAIDELRGAVTIVYPMGLPPHDPIRMEFENDEDLEGTQVRIIVNFLLKIINFLLLLLKGNFRNYQIRRSIFMV